MNVSNRNIELSDQETEALEAGIESSSLDRIPAWQALIGSWQDAEEIKKRFSPGTHGHHEACDRASMLMSTWNDFIVDHPSVVMSEEVYRLAYIAMHFMIATYQTLACQEPNENNEISISRAEYNDLLENSDFADALEDIGVDNWEGYEDAMRLFREKRIARADDYAMQYNSNKQNSV